MRVCSFVSYSAKDEFTLTNARHAHIFTSQKSAKGMIGMLGSIAITVNSLTGPAMLNLPATFQISGLIPTIFTLIMLCVLSALCSLTLSDVISNVPGNNNFRKEVSVNAS